ncbi:MAG: phosphoglycerate dehydrogenase [Christensenellaceae bacterium]|jgi:D-3-phosphoglycerate dehydrogenase|nr:phosphoglycerate dehydrogenase [Christensenellaceae bacterium]
MKILVTPTSIKKDDDTPGLLRLRGFADELVFNPFGRPLTEDELIPLLQGCDGYIAGLDQISEKVLSACPSLRVISRYGTGMDRVDLKAAALHAIAVTNTPGANAQAVAELAFGLILSLARAIPRLHQSTKEGNWERHQGMELGGKTIGILGLGAIGKRLAKCCMGFGMAVVAYDPFIDRAFCEREGIQIETMQGLLQKADIISIHLPLNDETKNLINADTIGLLKDGALLINASRGGIVEEAAVFNALKTGKLGGLGLDAFETEPPSASPLLQLPNVVATPHTGAHTKEAVLKMQEMAVDNLIAVLSGEDCPYRIQAIGA